MRLVRYYLAVLLGAFFIYSNFTFACQQISFVGDSNMSLFYLKPGVPHQFPQLFQSERFIDLVSYRMRTPIFDLSRGGANSADYLPGGKYFHLYRATRGYVVISLGLNDAKDFYKKFQRNHRLAWNDFRGKTSQLIRAVRAQGGIPVLMTGTAFDYPHHHSYDQGSIMWGYNQAYRELARHFKIGLIDVNQYLQNEIDQGRWDIHIRRSPGQYILDDRFDRGKEKQVTWFTDAHYNLRASRLISRWLLNWFATKTYCQ